MIHQSLPLNSAARRESLDLHPLDDVFFAALENREWLQSRQGHLMHYDYEYRLTRRLLPSIFSVLILLLTAAIIALYTRAITREAIIMVVLAIGIGVSVFVLQYPFLMSIRLRRLERRGELILGTVTAYHATSPDGDPLGWRDAVLEYRFTTPAGETISGQRRYRSTVLPRTPRLGDSVAILYINPDLYEVL